MVEYQWTIEERTVYDDGEFDIENRDFSDSLAKYQDSEIAKVDDREFVLTLVRRDWTADYMSFEWEEVEAKRDGNGVLMLSEHLNDIDGNPTRKVPKRFVKELADRQKSMKATV